MASADLKAELECSICLDIYTDPVMLKCGHNFCQKCINRVQDTQGGSSGYSCPECRQKFQNLHRNMKLRNIVEILSTQKSEVYCSFHPSKLLEYYCTEDDTCVCVSCCLIGEHKGHNMESLKEASGKKKDKMKNALQKLLTKRGKMEERVQSLQKCRKQIEVKAAGDTEKVTNLFRDLRRQMKVLEERVQNEISKQTKRVSLSMLYLIQDLEIKNKDLSRQIHDIEKLCNMVDPLTVLQKSDIGNLCDTDDGDNEDRPRLDKLLHDAGQLDMVKISQILQTGLSNIMAGVKVQKLTGTHLYLEEKGHIIEGVLQPASTIQSPHYQPEGPRIQTVLQMLGLSRNSDIILDINTAGNDLFISDNMRTVTWSVFTPKYPEKAERFQSAQVLSTQSFSSGQHYWEVDVERSKVWSVGMCYRSIDRRGCHSEIGWNTKSWGLHKSWLNDQYSVLYDRKWMRLSGKVSSNRLIIYLDYEAGQISFYDLCDPIKHLYTFNATFTEPLHAVLWVGGGCVKIVRGNHNM